MYHRYSTALSHLFLVSMGFYCFKLYSTKELDWTNKLPSLGYGIIITNSLFGIWKWGNPAHGRRTEKLYYSTRFVQTLFVFPCLVAQLWLNHLKNEQFAYLHPIFSLVPLILYLKQRPKQVYIDLILGLNILSCCWISFNFANWFGVALAVSYTINHFILKEDNEILDMPTIDFYNYALCFFLYFSVKALQET